MDTGNKFESKTVEGDKMQLVPVFGGRVDWKGNAGYDAMQLILSCLIGAFVLWDKALDGPMTRVVWKQQSKGAKWKPPIMCMAHGTVSETTSINHLQQGQGVGCLQCNGTVHWRDRFHEFKAEYETETFKLRTSEKDWKRDCNGNTYCPTFWCTEHKIEITSTSISNLTQDRGVGCPQCIGQMHWRNRFDEFKDEYVPKDFVLRTTEAEWKRDCNDKYYCPTLWCVEHEIEITSTCINNLKRGQGVGCQKCRNKTEAKLYEWLHKTFPGVTITHGKFSGPGATHFDFHVLFRDGPSDGPLGGFVVLIELDGPQHFWEDHHHFSQRTCELDLDKEVWAKKTKKLSVIRVLQQDVWSVGNGWELWIRSRIDKARASEPDVYAPDAPEYTSENSVYFQLHQPKTPSEAGPSSAPKNPKRPKTSMDMWLCK